MHIGLKIGLAPIKWQAIVENIADQKYMIQLMHL